MGRKSEWHEKDSFSAVRPLSDRVAGWFDWTSPNVVTLAGLLLAIPMIFCFARGEIALGAILFALSAATDFVDGALARYQDARMTDAEREAQGRRYWLFQRGKTEDGRIFTGASFDPFVDKLRYFGALIPLGWGPLSSPLIAAGAGFALLLTLGRPLFAWRGGTKGKANRWGKFKAHAEILLIAALVLLPRQGAWLVPAHVLLVAATALGAMSFGGQLMTLLKNRKAAP